MRSSASCHGISSKGVQVLLGAKTQVQLRIKLGALRASTSILRSYHLQISSVEKSNPFPNHKSNPYWQLPKKPKSTLLASSPIQIQSVLVPKRYLFQKRKTNPKTNHQLTFPNALHTTYMHDFPAAVGSSISKKFSRRDEKIASN